MIKTVKNPKEALLQSYSKPIAYKSVILYQGKVIVRYKSTAKTG